MSSLLQQLNELIMAWRELLMWPPHPAIIAFVAFVIVLVFALIALVETLRINKRRENEEMFGTQTFDSLVAERGFSDKEIRTLDKIIRKSTFENKDAILNSSGLFEQAVSTFYEFRDVLKVSDETVEAVERLRNKMNFTASNPLSEIYSTRQFNVGDRIDMVPENGTLIKRSEIIWRTEKEWAISYDGSDGPAKSFVGREIRIRWTRPDDAIYSTSVLVRRLDDSDNFVLLHSSELSKRQLRRWVREQVAFPVTAVFENGETLYGTLLDLSAGGIMIGLPKECYPGQRLRIQFELPSFGDEDVEIEILRNLGQKNQEFPNYYCLTASFRGKFGWTQERVLQYLFELSKSKKETKKLAEQA
ncbi:MAG: PilZ domain-containing protein [Fibrobacter sp.]|nr:PilZ domain-containing protein [Fibrobacter sp.]